MAKKAKKRSRAVKPQENPEWLWRDAESHPPPPPVRTRLSRLPFDQLEWEDFERLCRRLAERGGQVERVWAYGKSGHAQSGIDILVRMKDGIYEVWQTKRYKKIRPGDVTKAVGLFLKHKWASRAKRFALIVACEFNSPKVVEAVEKARDRLKLKAIAFEPLDAEKLTEQLRSEPYIVDDFFDRPWVEAVCPPEALARLANRISHFGLASLRQRLRECYRSWVATVDPGLLVAGLDRSSRARPAVSIARRYVQPDLIVRTSDNGKGSEPESEKKPQRPAPADDYTVNPVTGKLEPSQARSERTSFPIIREQRIALDAFLAGDFLGRSSPVIPAPERARCCDFGPRYPGRRARLERCPRPIRWLHSRVGAFRLVELNVLWSCSTALTRNCRDRVFPGAERTGSAKICAARSPMRASSCLSMGLTKLRIRRRRRRLPPSCRPSLKAAIFRSS